MSIQLKAMISLLCLGAGAMAAAADFEDYGRVVSVAPQVEQINTPRQECRTEYAPAPLGNHVGGGNGRTAATAAGAIAGAIVGDRIQNNPNQPGTVEQQPVRHCRTVDNWQTRTNGYAVTYEYHGRTYTSVMPYDPGERVRLHVAVTPRI
jgi:uncharacterized protein YcfJ